MHFLSKARFSLTGKFEGFVRNRDDKRRMILRVEQHGAMELKLPKELRKQFERHLSPGVSVSVIGTEYRNFADERKLVVSHLRVLSPVLKGANTCERCPIRICAKKHCWKNGGRALFDALQKELKVAGLEQEFEVKAVGCLDHCKHGPNVEVGKTVIEHCDRYSAEDLLEQIRALRR